MKMWWSRGNVIAKRVYDGSVEMWWLSWRQWRCDGSDGGSRDVVAQLEAVEMWLSWRHCCPVEMWWLRWRQWRSSGSHGDPVAHLRCGGSVGDVVAKWRYGGSHGGS